MSVIKKYPSLLHGGDCKLTSLQAIGLGSLSVQYFQWRKSRGSFEKFHGAVVGHGDHGDTRIFREVSRLGERPANLSDAVYDTCNRPKTAMIFDWENWWALEDAAGPRIHMEYVKTFLAHYKPFWSIRIFHTVSAWMRGREKRSSSLCRTLIRMRCR